MCGAADRASRREVFINQRTLERVLAHIDTAVQPTASKQPVDHEPTVAPAVAEEALTLRVTLDTPSTNLVRKMTFALLNIPSFSDTTMNCRGRTQQEQAGQQRCE